MTKIFNADTINPEVELTNEEELAHAYMELVTHYKELIENGKQLAYLQGLFEHFIVRSGFETKFVKFLKDVVENEKEETYKNAALAQLGLYHVASEGFFSILDEYGMMKEEKENLIWPEEETNQ